MEGKVSRRTKEGKYSYFQERHEEGSRQAQALQPDFQHAVRHRKEPLHVEIVQ